ncbi:unnamed protein product [Penicillium roqueforti FM164]|uniref:Genomic scaffold, ProqFM164S04 n=1 Tax=Penicillium roqueforti (strain FM164) TaxID=1365484 RepID=W6R2P8_PENRF|nr:unnamed protein product [Penicillium roqueforti FM164]
MFFFLIPIHYNRTAFFNSAWFPLRGARVRMGYTVDHPQP